jgi:hypothetical protein
MTVRQPALYVNNNRVLFADQDPPEYYKPEHFRETLGVKRTFWCNTATGIVYLRTAYSNVWERQKFSKSWVKEWVEWVNNVLSICGYVDAII